LNIDLLLNYNSNFNILYNRFCFYSSSDKIAEFNNIYLERTISELRYINIFTIQHFAVYKVTNTENKKFITFVIFNIRFLEKSKRISIYIDLSLEVLLNC
jgi:hypothetical protein